MTEEKSKISEALKNFSNFFNVPGYSIDAWQKSYPWLFNRQEDISFVSQIMQSIDFRNDSYLRTALYIAEEYKNKEFDSSLEFEMRGSFSKIDQLFGIDLILEDGFLNKLVKEIFRLCKSNQRNPKAVIDWIEEYLAKINLDEIKGILMDFCDKSATRKGLGELEKGLKELKENNEKFKSLKAELNVTGEWERHFESRARGIEKEINNLHLESKIKNLRTALYSIPLLAFLFLMIASWSFSISCTESSSFSKLQILVFLSTLPPVLLLFYFNKEGSGKIRITKIFAIYAAIQFFIFLIGLFILNGVCLGIAKSANFPTKEFLIPISAATLLLTSIISYHLKHALRELNILKQMRASYLHRAITAKTFKELVASGHFKDDRSEVVVKEAAMAMFKKDSVGYLSKDQLEPSNTPVQEVVGIFHKG